ncbi:MAG TPA: Crp/Fnr family transcriptional regulator [Burkholderiales bacterium]
MNLARALRLVSTGPERQALKAGEVDAVIDSASGNVFLLSQAKRALSSAGGEAANGLLAALPRQTYLRLLTEMELVPLTRGQVLYQPGERIQHVYFPNDAVVSLLAVLELKALEVCLVGREGMVGIPLVLGAERASARAMVQGTGTALRMKAASFRDELERCVPLQRELQRYAHVKLLQARQAAGCSRFHRVEERLAYWLLMAHDRTTASGLQLTHELLADMLGVRRVGVTNAAGELQRRGLIEYHRGDIRVRDRKGLEAAACSCYRTVKTLTG